MERFSNPAQLGGIRATERRTIESSAATFPVSKYLRHSVEVRYE